MSESPPDLQESIRLAIEAAEAANDASAEVAVMKTKTEQSADRIDRFGSTMKPVMIGTLVGSVIIIGLGSLVYFRTLSEMRRATATQLEALTMFASRVEQIDDQLATLGAVSESIEALNTSQSEALMAMQEKLDGMGNSVVEKISGYSENAGNLQSQIARTISETVESNHASTRDAMTAGLSDLQLALSRMMADVVTAAPAPMASSSANKPAVAKPAPKPAPKPVPRSASARPKPAPAPKPNPFSYP